MGGEQTQRSQSSSTQTERGETRSGLGSTPTAMGALPGYTDEFGQTLDVGPYTGPVASHFDYSGSGPPIQGDVSGFVAQPNALELEGLDAAASGIQGLSGLTGQTAGNVGQYWADVTAAGPGGIIQSSPFQSLLDTLSAENQETLDFQNSRISDIFAGSGGWGGTEQARATGFATEEAMEAQAQQEAALGWQAFQLGHDLMGRAPSGAAAGLQLAGAPGEAQTRIGAQQRGLGQLGLDEELAQSELDFSQGQQQFQNELFQAGLGQQNSDVDIANAMAENEALRTGNTDLYARFFDTLQSGVFGQNTTANTSSTGRSSSSGTASDPGAGVSQAGDLLSAAALAYMAFFSDERLKERIEFIGERKGFRWYTFRFREWARRLLGLPQGEQIGVMAQEVQALVPSAVHVMPNGFLAVDYAKVI